MERVWEVYSMPSSPNELKKAVLPLGTKSKHYFVGRHSLRMDGCVVSVEQPSLGLQLLEKAKFVTELCVCLLLCGAVHIYCCVCE